MKQVKLGDCGPQTYQKKKVTHTPFKMAGFYELKNKQTLAIHGTWQRPSLSKWRKWSISVASPRT